MQHGPDILPFSNKNAPHHDDPQSGWYWDDNGGNFKVTFGKYKDNHVRLHNIPIGWINFVRGKNYLVVRFIFTWFTTPH